MSVVAELPVQTPRVASGGSPRCEEVIEALRTRCTREEPLRQEGWSRSPSKSYFIEDPMEYEFSEAEVSALADLRASLKQVAEWPPDSPLSFVPMLAPRTRGKLGELLLARIATDAGMTIGKAESVAYDVRIGPARCEVKFSTEDPPRFQQVRNPRQDGGTKYDYLVCISGRPHGLVYWLIPAEALGGLMDDGHITIQHAMSDTKWFRPSRTASDAFSSFRYFYEDLVPALVGASTPANG